MWMEEVAGFRAALYILLSDFPHLLHGQGKIAPMSPPSALF
jgi:hypothetical protein